MIIFEIPDVTWLYDQMVPPGGRQPRNFKGDLALWRSHGEQGTSGIVFRGQGGDWNLLAETTDDGGFGAYKDDEGGPRKRTLCVNRFIELTPDDIRLMFSDFKCRSEADIDRFVAAVESEVEFYTARANFLDELMTTLRVTCKSQAHVDFRALAARYDEDFAKFYSWLPGFIPTAFVEAMCRGMIDDGVLSGIVDETAHEYTDERFITQQRRIVNINVEMDFNSLVQQLGNKGVSLQAVECPQCGSANTIPGEGSSFICGSCGSVIQATDIFEKFKSLF